MSTPHENTGTGHDGYSEPGPFEGDRMRDRDRYGRDHRRHGTIPAGGAVGMDEDALRRRAVGNLHARRSFWMQLGIYVIINAVLFWAWANNGFGFPWPLFVLVFWGIGLMWQGIALFGRGDDESRIQREMDRLSGRR